MSERMSLADIRVFDRKDGFAVSFGRLPHWSQAGALTFITWRTADSMPKSVVDRWVEQRTELLEKYGLDPSSNWRAAMNEMSIEEANLLRWDLIEQFDIHLDACHGQCVLRAPQFAKIVAQSLRKFDGDRYVLTDFVVMPNHVHVLAAFPTEEALRSQISNWKRFQAREIQLLHGRRRHFWQEEDFDHLIRSEEQFHRFRTYIADNPMRARLRKGEFFHWTCSS